MKNSLKKPTSFKQTASAQVTADICLGERTEPIGRLVFVRDGQREFTQFAYTESWLSDSAFFNISPDLIGAPGYQLHKPFSQNDSRFFWALADTEPDAWGRRVIARAHAKRRETEPTLQALCEFDYLVAVDDVSRVGALRVRDTQGQYLAINHDARKTPPLLELEKILSASRAIELNEETTQDLAYLQGKATSLGGMRPKCTLIDNDGTLAIGKFPSVSDDRAVTEAEVLALELARAAGIDAAVARTVSVGQQAVAVIRRFDRTATGSRIAYMSGATVIQARRDEDRSYTELLDAMRNICDDYVADACELYRRIVFNHLINNVDDHLQNVGFLQTSRSKWRLAPAFDINPFPDKSPESKTWLSPETGPITSIDHLIAYAPYFELKPDQLRSVMSDLVTAVEAWRHVAQTPTVGMTSTQANAFKPAFEGTAVKQARAWLA
jgi:serine/threonine-protein kinase HipA